LIPCDTQQRESSLIPVIRRDRQGKHEIGPTYGRLASYAEQAFAANVPARLLDVLRSVEKHSQDSSQNFSLQQEELRVALQHPQSSLEYKLTPHAMTKYNEMKEKARHYTVRARNVDEGYFVVYHPGGNNNQHNNQQ
jgi:hypothetical protein